MSIWKYSVYAVEVPPVLLALQVVDVSPKLDVVGNGVVGNGVVGSGVVGNGVVGSGVCVSVESTPVVSKDHC